MVAPIYTLKYPPRSESESSREGREVRPDYLSGNWTMAAEEPIVEFKVKDLFLEIKRDLVEIKQTLQTKADKSELDKLETTVAQMKETLSTKAAIEVVQANTRSTRLQWVGIVLASLLSTAGIIVELLRH